MIHRVSISATMVMFKTQKHNPVSNVQITAINVSQVLNVIQDIVQMVLDKLKLEIVYNVYLVLDAKVVTVLVK